jgi:hypothetical protein
LLLATATPAQLRPVEAWDLLDVLNRGGETVLGGLWSRWRQAEKALGLVMGEIARPEDELEMWEWIRTPFPPRDEGKDFEILRRQLGMADDAVSAAGSDWEKLGPPDKARVRHVFPRLVEQHNPFIRHIVRRSRKYLEETRDPETGEPYLAPIKVELHGEREDDAIRLPPYLREAYELAEDFCQKLGARMRGSGFLKTLLLRRVGSSISAGRKTAEQMLGSWEAIETGEALLEDDEEERGTGRADAMSRTLTSEERALLERFVAALEANQERDPKYAAVLDCLTTFRWLEKGCIVFSQYFDSVRWLAGQLTEDLQGEPIGLYAGSGKSGTWENGRFAAAAREDIKQRVRRGQLRLLLGTDAASEGLNLQRLGTLINLDLPWNPTRLEHRKGRIQRIGQLNDTVHIYNLRYLGSVEDRVHHLLSSRLQDIYTLFGQIPDVLEDVWIDVAMGEIEHAKQIIAAIPRRHPFDLKYQRISKIDWESCERVLASAVVRAELSRGW